MTATFFEEDNLQALLEKIAQDEGFQKPTYRIENGSKPGQNYIGRIFRVLITENLDGNEKSLSLIFKASSTNRERQDMMGGDRVFATEKNMYEIVLPTLNDFLKKHGVADQPVFPGTPRCMATEMNYAALTGKADIIVLEDKKVQGYEIADIKTGLNEEQCRLALKRIALLHSTSMALNELEPESAKRLESLLFKHNVDEAFMEKFKEPLAQMRQGYIHGLGMLEEPYKPGNPTYDSLNKTLDIFTQEMVTRFDRPEEFFTATHNDFTSNNIMYRINEDGSTEDACVIDFQMAACTSIGNDLASLLIFCTTKEVRDEHYQNLLQFYFDEVTKSLQSFGCDPAKIFPWETFQKYLKKSMKIAIPFSLLGLPVMLADFSEINVDIHSNEANVDLFSEMAKAANTESINRVKKRLTELVSDAERLGYI